MSSLFGKTKELEASIDAYLDDISTAALIFKAAIKDYFSDNYDDFQRRINDIDKLEAEADRLRRNIRHKLYSQMLIPEARGDVLGLLENSDQVIDMVKKVLIHFDIERPEIPDFLKKDFIALAESSGNAADEMVQANRAFFTEIKAVNDHINKVNFFEHEADAYEEKIKKIIFSGGQITDLSHKIHLRYFVEKIALISDEAQNVCERLSVYVIKRSI